MIKEVLIEEVSRSRPINRSHRRISEFTMLNVKSPHLPTPKAWRSNRPGGESAGWRFNNDHFPPSKFLYRIFSFFLLRVDSFCFQGTVPARDYRNWGGGDPDSRDTEILGRETGTLTGVRVAKMTRQQRTARVLHACAAVIRYLEPRRVDGCFCCRRKHGRFGTSWPAFVFSWVCCCPACRYRCPSPAPPSPSRECPMVAYPPTFAPYWRIPVRKLKPNGSSGETSSLPSYRITADNHPTPPPPRCDRRSRSRSFCLVTGLSLPDSITLSSDLPPLRPAAASDSFPLRESRCSLNDGRASLRFTYRNHKIQYDDLHRSLLFPPWFLRFD